MKSLRFCWPLTRGNPLHYLRIFISFCYYSGILPFRIVFDQELDNYIVRTNPLQKIFCIFTLTMCLCEEIISIRSSIDSIRNPENEKRTDPIIYFEMFSVVSNFIYYVTVLRTVWFKSRRFLAVIQHLHEQDRRATVVMRIRRKSNMKAKICCVLTVFPFIIYPATFILGFFINKSSFNWDQRINYWGENASKAFFGETYFHNFPYFLKFILGIMRNVFLLGYTQITTSMEMLGMTASMLMFDAVQDFNDIVKNAKEYTSYELLQEYDLLRSLSRKSNKAIGFLTFGLTLACMPYYIANLLEFINPDNIAVFFRHLIFFTNSFGFLILAAQINKKAHMLEERLLTEKDFNDISPNALSIFLHDLSGHNIGISGSGFFIVSPGFVGTIISLLLTFSIIIIQFENSNFPIAAVT